jgi:hypothetical protein
MANNPTGEPDPAPFKVHLMVKTELTVRRAGGVVREFTAKDEAIRFARRQPGGHYAVYHKYKKIWPAP